MPDGRLGLGDHGLYRNLFFGNANFLEHGFIADGRVAVGSDPVNLLTCFWTSFELVFARKIFPLGGISIIDLLEVHFQFIAICTQRGATCVGGGYKELSKSSILGLAIKGTVDPIPPAAITFVFIDAELGADFLCACSRCYVSCAKK